MRDISLLINEIKLYLNIKTDSELATFLGTTQSNIATWKKRDSINYELIIAKCPEIDANWLITGNGNMLRPKKKEVITYTDPDDPFRTITEEIEEDEVNHNDNESYKEKYILLLERYTALLEGRIKEYVQHIENIAK